MSANGTERERKFLVRETPPGLSQRSCEQIEQGYLAVDSSGVAGDVEVRIRRSDDHAVLTVKGGSGMSRREVEMGLPAAAAKKLWPLTKGRRLSKRRYVVPVRGAQIQVDVYGGKLRGLVVAEFEHRSLRALRKFSPPKWLGREVTGKRAYSNSQLAKAGRPRTSVRGK
jgi:adenylate cyclase